ncbi:MAG: hypothetical protein EBS86_11685 [Crocinitomicaceae bacterium]|nr:hypothetical protein [Crocinitomicaceae bacterium]
MSENQNQVNAASNIINTLNNFSERLNSKAEIGREYVVAVMRCLQDIQELIARLLAKCGNENLKKLVEELKQTIETQNAEINNLSNTNKELQSKLVKMDQLLSLADQQINALKEEIERLKNENKNCDVLEGQVEQLKKNLQEVIGQLNQANQKNANMEQFINQISQKITLLTDGLNKTSPNVGDMNVLIAKCKKLQQLLMSALNNAESQSPTPPQMATIYNPPENVEGTNEMNTTPSTSFPIDLSKMSPFRYLSGNKGGTKKRKTYKKNKKNKRGGYTYKIKHTPTHKKHYKTYKNKQKKHTNTHTDKNTTK